MFTRPAYHVYSRLRDNMPASLPWTSGDSGVKGDPRKTVKWVDGLRGIASFLVLLTHLSRAWDYDLFSPRDSEEVPPRWMQEPILRIAWQGRIGVTIFGFLTGYVCALKPLKLRRAGNTSAAFTTVAKSAFRRPPRLVFPATVAMIISWIVAQFGGFTVANRSDCGWCRNAAVDLTDSLYSETVRLFMSFLSTWTNGYMPYDDHQWAMLPLLQSSMVVYVLLCATMFCKYRYRFLICVGMILYYHQNNTYPHYETFQQQAVYGMLMCDMSYEQSFKDFLASQKYRWFRRMSALVVLFIGLMLASYPENHPEWAPWSDYLFENARYLFPPDSDLPKKFTAVGFDFIVVAIVISPTTKDFLSNRLLLWFGKQSFAVYLVHGTLLRVPLIWALYGISGEPWVGTVDDAGNVTPPDWLPVRGLPWSFMISIPCWLVLVYGCATLWTTYVDPFCARMTQKLEDRFFEEDEKSSPAIPMTTRPMQMT